MDTAIFKDLIKAAKFAVKNLEEIAIPMANELGRVTSLANCSGNLHLHTQLAESYINLIESKAVVMSECKGRTVIVVQYTKNGVTRNGRVFFSIRDACKEITRLARELGYIKVKYHRYYYCDKSEVNNPGINKENFCRLIFRSVE